MGRDPRPTPHSRAAEKALQPTEDHMPPGSPSEELYLEMGKDWVDLANALTLLLFRDDGWLRISPQDNGETVYFKWKWTAGKHINHYVMTVYHASKSTEALRRLAMKVHAVDSGKERPVKDHYFKG